MSVNKIGFGLVRDKNGKPKFDSDPSGAHPAILAMLTQAERKEFGLWDGPFCRDAEGTKRLNKVGDDFEVVDALVAASEVYDGDQYFRLRQRVDVPVGGIIRIGD